MVLNLILLEVLWQDVPGSARVKELVHKELLLDLVEVCLLDFLFLRLLSSLVKVFQSVVELFEDSHTLLQLSYCLVVVLDEKGHLINEPFLGSIFWRATFTWLGSLRVSGLIEELKEVCDTKVVEYVA